MKLPKSPQSTTIFAGLNVVKFILVLLMVLMFINLNAEVARQSRSTESIARSTNQVVKSQEDILNAIKQVTDDTRITAEQQTTIIICMLQVPLAERSTDLENKCFKQVRDAAADSAAERKQNSTGSAPASSSNTTPVAPVPQSNTSQPKSDSPVAAGSPPEDTQNFIEKLFSPINNLLNR